MNDEMKKNRKLWTDALRSGKYPQGTGSLCKNGMYCCLGVLCEIMGATKLEEGEYTLYEGNSSICPTSVMDKVGLVSSTGWFRQKGRRECLTHLNDTDWSFNQIADLIDREPEGLFQQCDNI